LGEHDEREAAMAEPVGRNSQGHLQFVTQTRSGEGGGDCKKRLIGSVKGE